MMLPFLVNSLEHFVQQHDGLSWIRNPCGCASQASLEIVCAGREKLISHMQRFASRDAVFAAAEETLAD